MSDGFIPFALALFIVTQRINIFWSDLECYFDGATAIRVYSSVHWQ